MDEIQILHALRGRKLDELVDGEVVHGPFVASHHHSLYCTNKTLTLSSLPTEIKNAPQPFFIKPITRTITGRVDDAYLLQNYDTHFSFLNSQLETSPDNGEFLCGAQLTAADILLSFPLIITKSDNFDFSKYPKLSAYIDRLAQHPGYLESVKKIEEVTGEKFESNLRGKK
jgi:glutathione S-transferase